MTSEVSASSVSDSVSINTSHSCKMLFLANRCDSHFGFLKENHIYLKFSKFTSAILNFDVIFDDLMYVFLGIKLYDAHYNHLLEQHDTRVHLAHHLGKEI